MIISLSNLVDLTYGFTGIATLINIIYAKSESLNFKLKEWKLSKDPLHGKRLDELLQELVDFYGWEQLGNMVDIRCFQVDPNMKSSLHFLRRTPWAREKVEKLYLYMKEQMG